MSPQQSLEQTLVTTETLLSQYLDALSPNKAEAITISDPPPPLPLLNDCARLLKAQVTKLSLLAINKPFSPNAIRSVLADTVTSCLPAMMSAVQICESQRDVLAGFFVDEVRARVRRVVSEMLGVVKEIASIAAQVNDSGSSSKLSDQGGRDSLSSTGIVWSGCDGITALVTAGVASLAVQKAETYRDMIKDAIAELQEWREGDDLDNEGIEDHLLDSDDEGVDGDRDSLNGIFNAANSLPSDRPALRKLVESAEDRLKKIVILYTALVKRRLKSFPTQPTVNDTESMHRLGTTVVSFKHISNMVDDLASSFYDLDEEAAKHKLDGIVKKAIDCATTMRLNDKGELDEFSEWLTKWNDIMDPTGG